MTVQYLKLLQQIKDHGVQKGDRTGTGTISLFGPQLEFDLNEGFPLLTTKKLPFRWIAEELLWFLSGSTNVKDLQARGVDIWDEWATEEQCAKFSRKEGDLGPVYGWQWRNFGKPYPIETSQPTPSLRAGVEATYLDVGNGAGKSAHVLGKRWEGMMARCYDSSSVSYKYYGARGVHVCNRWLEFAAFAADAHTLPGYDGDNLSNLELDKDSRGTGYEYGPANCQWLSKSENASLRDQRTFVLAKDGKQYRVQNVAAFCEEHGIDGRNMSDLWTGRKNAKVRHGFRLVRIEDPNKGVDQIAQIVELLRENPNSRRILLTGWNPKEALDVAIPPCHTVTQFYVADGKLSAKMYQRSADVFLGVPFNIASYALLTHMLAQVANLGVGRFIHTFGDVHIYNNHMNQVDEQLSRTPAEMPGLLLNASVMNIDKFTYEDMKLVDYYPQSRIKAPVSV